MPRLGWYRATGLLTLWLGFACVCAAPPSDERQIYFAQDQAQLLTAADETLRGNLPLVGAPSRFGLFHPGPLFVYLLAIIHAATGHREALTISAVSWLQASTVPLLSLLAFRLSGSFALAVALPFVFVFNYPFLLYMRFLWNISIITPALALAFWLAMESDRKAAWTLPALALTLSLVAQAHIGFLPLAAWLGAATAARLVLSRRARFGPVSLAALALALVWTPVARDALLHGGGQVAKVIARFSATHEPRPMKEVFGAIDSLAAETLPGGARVRCALLTAPFALLVMASLGRRARVSQFRWFLLLLAGSWATFVLSARAVLEPIQTYYLRPACVLVAATVIGGIAAFLDLIPRSNIRRVVAWVFAGLVLALSIRPARDMKRRLSDPSWNNFPLAGMREVVGAIASRLGPAAPRQAAIDFRLGDLSGAQASILYLLGRQGIERVSSPNAPLFRLTLVRESIPATEGRWVEVARTKQYKVEMREPGEPPEAERPTRPVRRP